MSSKVESLSAKFGEAAVFKISALAGSSYRWEVSNLSKNLDCTMEAIPAKSGPNSDAMITSVFYLKAKKPGSYDIDLELVAPFMSLPADQRKLRVTFQ